MSAVLLAAVLVLTALTLANLVLLLGVIRRLSDHERRLAGLGGAMAPVSASTLAVGARVADFNATTTTGRPLSRDAIDGYVLVGFFSTTCEACHERLPDFVAAARTHPAAIAVVVRDGDTASLTGQLDGIDTVVEDPNGPVAAAFGVHGFPTFMLLDSSGTIRAQGFELPLPVVPV